MTRTVIVNNCISRYVDSRHPAANYATDEIRADFSAQSSDVLNYRQEMLVQFDLSQAAGGKISSAEMYFFLNLLSQTSNGAQLYGGMAIAGTDFATADYNTILTSFVADGTVSTKHLSSLAAGAYNKISATITTNPDYTRQYAYRFATSGIIFYLAGFTVLSYPYSAEMSFGSLLSDNPPYLQMTVEDVAINSISLSPSYGNVNRAQENEFTWDIDFDSTFVVGNITTTGADLQYSTDESTWATLATVTGPAHSAVIPAGTLPTGTVYWRVRSYNYSGEAGEWSHAAAINVIEPATPPTISAVTPATARPTVSWTASAQQAYELKIMRDGVEIWSSSTVITASKSCKIGALLADGSYTVKVRVYSNDGSVSNWTQYSFVVSTSKPSVPALAATPIEGGVTLAVTADAGTTVYILRDGVVIGKAINGTYTDYAGAGTCSYIARSVTLADCYSDSAEVSATPMIPCALLAKASNLADFVRLKYNRGDPPKRSFNWSAVGSGSHYSGGEYPSYEYEAQTDEDANYSYSFRARADFLALKALANARETLLLRERSGARTYGVITGVSWETTQCSTDVTFSFSRTDYSEVIPYD